MIIDDRSSIITDYSHESNVILIMFGGIQGGLGIPLFEFYQLVAKLHVKKIFIRDLNQTWYQMGLKGIMDNLESVADFLKSEITSQKTAVVSG